MPHGLFEMSLFWVAVVTLLFWAAFGVEAFLGSRLIGTLKDVPPLASGPMPKVSVIIAARNEQRNIEPALRSVLAQDYPNLEFIVIDDRSVDQTGAILDRMAQADARLHVVHVTELPGGWLGKNHAQFTGAQQASGELLLFTDADVVMQPDTVSRAVAYLTGQRLDHLAIGPEVHMPTRFLEMFVGAFALFFTMYALPWRAKNPKSRYHIGIGAFNMVRADVYRAVGTHRAIALRLDDDMKLGKLIKRAGYRQEMLFGREMISVEWYASVRELIDGLTKNAFAGVEFSVAAVVGATMFQLLFQIWPYVAVFATGGATRFMNITIVAIIALLCWGLSWSHRGNRWTGLGFPIATLLFVYICWRSMLLALLNDGIQWRGTHYSLDELKSNKV